MITAAAGGTAWHPSALHAGACHDLGHGPFSHVFEHEVLPRIYGHAPGHENMRWCAACAGDGWLLLAAGWLLVQLASRCPVLYRPAGCSAARPHAAGYAPAAAYTPSLPHPSIPPPHTPTTRRSHEDMSNRLLDHIIDQNYLELATYDLVESDVRLVKDLMSGNNRREKKWVARWC